MFSYTSIIGLYRGHTFEQGIRNTISINELGRGQYQCRVSCSSIINPYRNDTLIEPGIKNKYQ